MLLPAEPTPLRSIVFAGHVASPGLPTHIIGAICAVWIKIAGGRASCSYVSHSTIDDAFGALIAGPSCMPLTTTRLTFGELRFTTVGTNAIIVSRMSRSFAPTKYPGAVGSIEPS